MGGFEKFSGGPKLLALFDFPVEIRFGEVFIGRHQKRITTNRLWGSFNARRFATGTYMLLCMTQRPGVQRASQPIYYGYGLGSVGWCAPAPRPSRPC